MARVQSVVVFKSESHTATFPRWATRFSAWLRWRIGAQTTRWLAIRNVSDPQMSADGLTLKHRANIATQIYKGFGSWSSVCSAIVCWASFARTRSRSTASMTWSVSLVWRIELTATAAKQLGKLDRNEARRITAFLRERLASREDPHDLGKALTGPTLSIYWRCQVGDYRLICDIDDGAVRILVIELGNRREVYH